MAERRPLNAAKVRSVLAVWIFLAGLIGLLTAALYIDLTLAIYPANHIASYGRIVPAVSEAYAAWLPHAPTGLVLAAVASVAVWFFNRRSVQSPDSKAFVLALIAAIDLFLAFFCTIGLLLAYFYLPKIANGA